ncbi:MAG: WYL domain-containing protein [Lachnospiraceae bacterium]|jgi:predicted DNA-binding transcriptional regulator YafY|nr:WYL domain-containing protein [Lachnospiraceae bacterium]
MENVTRLRLLYLYRILEDRTNDKNPLPVSDLISILNTEYGIKTDRNALARDFNTLVDAGYPIQIKHEARNLYYYTGRVFEDAELKILIDAVASSKFIPEEESRSLITRLAGMTGPEESRKLCSHVCVVGRVKSQNYCALENAEVINQAIEEKRQISFQYSDYNTDKKRVLRHDGQFYFVSPYTLVWDGDYYYVIGFNEDKKTVENFRVDRIWKHCVMLEEESSAVPDYANLSDYLKRTFQMFSADRSTYVDLICQRETMKFLIDKFGESVETTKIDEESFSARVYVDLSPTFYRWVFGFHGDIRITGPKKALDSYHAMARQALDLPDA